MLHGARDRALIPSPVDGCRVRMRWNAWGVSSADSERAGRCRVDLGWCRRGEVSGPSGGPALGPVPWRSIRARASQALPRLRPFDVLRDVAAFAMGVGREDNPEVVKSQLHRLGRLGISDDDAAIIGAMYGLRNRREGRVDVERMIGAAARLVEGISRSGPVIIAVDDVQYIGSMERQIIGAALRGQRENPLLFMFAGRDEMPSEFRPADLRIALGRLKERRLEELVGEFLGANEIDPGFSTSSGPPPRGIRSTWTRSFGL